MPVQNIRTKRPRPGTKWRRKYYETHKATLIELLGGRCVYCGATEKLTFDHIDGDRDWVPNQVHSTKRLTMPQIEEVKPPPNPAKATDSRFEEYREKYGDESWELDALDPTYIGNLIAREMTALIKTPAWERAKQARDAGRARLVEVADSM